jgi:hypothetical protein
MPGPPAAAAALLGQSLKSEGWELTELASGSAASRALAATRHGVEILVSLTSTEVGDESQVVLTISDR